MTQTPAVLAATPHRQAGAWGEPVTGSSPVLQSALEHLRLKGGGGGVQRSGAVSGDGRDALNADADPGVALTLA
jgi:hypothetical protein